MQVLRYVERETKENKKSLKKHHILTSIYTHSQSLHRFNSIVKYCSSYYLIWRLQGPVLGITSDFPPMTSVLLTKEDFSTMHFSCVGISLAISRNKIKVSPCRLRHGQPIKRQYQCSMRIVHCACGSHCSSRTMDGSLFAPSMNSSNDSFPSLFLSIWRNILSVRFSGVDSSSGIFMTDPTIL